MVRSMSTTGCTVEALLVPCRTHSVSMTINQASQKNVLESYRRQA